MQRLTDFVSEEETQFDGDSCEGEVAEFTSTLKGRWNRLRLFGTYMGPGCLVAIAYLDPGNLSGDLAIGSIREEPDSGYQLLWLLLWGHIIGSVFQILSLRLGNVTGSDLAT